MGEEHLYSSRKKTMALVRNFRDEEFLSTLMYNE